MHTRVVREWMPRYVPDNAPQLTGSLPWSYNYGSHNNYYHAVRLAASYLKIGQVQQSIGIKMIDKAREGDMGLATSQKCCQSVLDQRAREDGGC